MSSSKSQFNVLYRLFNRRRIIRNLEIFQDFIVIALMVCLLVDMVFLLVSVIQTLLQLQTADFKSFTSDILFLLILVELFRLLVVYLQEHRISVEVAVEVAIVSVIREVIVHGALEIEWRQMLAICFFLLVTGGLLLICHQNACSTDLAGNKPTLILKRSGSKNQHSEDE